MKWQVIMTDTAKRDLREIAQYILEQSGDRETAASFVTALRERCLVLATQPETGAYPKDAVLRSLNYRDLVHRHDLVFCQIDGKEHKVCLLAFFHEKLDYFQFMLKHI